MFGCSVSARCCCLYNLLQKKARHRGHRVAIGRAAIDFAEVRPFSSTPSDEPKTLDRKRTQNYGKLTAEVAGRWDRQALSIIRSDR